MRIAHPRASDPWVRAVLASPEGCGSAAERQEARALLGDDPAAPEDLAFLVARCAGAEELRTGAGLVARLRRMGADSATVTAAVEGGAADPLEAAWSAATGSPRLGAAVAERLADDPEYARDAEDLACTFRNLDPARGSALAALTVLTARRRDLDALHGLAAEWYRHAAGPLLAAVLLAGSPSTLRTWRKAARHQDTAVDVGIRVLTGPDGYAPERSYAARLAELGEVPADAARRWPYASAQCLRGVSRLLTERGVPPSSPLWDRLVGPLGPRLVRALRTPDGDDAWPRRVEALEILPNASYADLHRLLPPGWTRADLARLVKPETRDLHRTVREIFVSLHPLDPDPNEPEPVARAQRELEGLEDPLLLRQALLGLDPETPLEERSATLLLLAPAARAAGRSPLPDWLFLLRRGGADGTLRQRAERFARLAATGADADEVRQAYERTLGTEPSATFLEALRIGGGAEAAGQAEHLLARHPDLGVTLKALMKTYRAADPNDGAREAVVQASLVLERTAGDAAAARGVLRALRALAGKASRLGRRRYQTPSLDALRVDLLLAPGDLAAKFGLYGQLLEKTGDPNTCGWAWRILGGDGERVQACLHLGQDRPLEEALLALQVLEAIVGEAEPVRKLAEDCPKDVWSWLADLALRGWTEKRPLRRPRRAGDLAGTVPPSCPASHAEQAWTDLRALAGGRRAEARPAFRRLIRHLWEHPGASLPELVARVAVAGGPLEEAAEVACAEAPEIRAEPGEIMVGGVRLPRRPGG